MAHLDLVEVPIFKKTHELSKLLKDMKSLSDKSIQVLKEGLDSSDPKVQRDCAKLIIDYLISLGDKVNSDQLQRAILEVKMKGATPYLKPEDKAAPRLDFNNISNV